MMVRAGRLELLQSKSLGIKAEVLWVFEKIELWVNLTCRSVEVRG